MAQERTHPDPTRHLRRRGKWLLLFAAVGVLIAVLVFRYLTQPQQLARFVAQQLAEALGADVNIRSAALHLRWREQSMVLEDVRIDLPDAPDDTTRLATVTHIHAQLDLWALVTGGPGVRTVLLNQPEVFVIENLDTGRYNYQYLIESEPDEPPGDHRAMPNVFVVEGAVHFSQVEWAESRTLASVPFSGSFTADPQDADLYHFLLRQAATVHGDGPRLIGNLRVDAGTGGGTSFDAELENFEFDSPQQYMMPTRYRKWWAQFNPSGTVPTVHVGYDARRGRFARFVIDGGEITLPIGDESLHHPRMTDVAGEVALTGDTIVLNNVSGRLGGLAYTLSGTITDLGEGPVGPQLLAIAPFDMTVKVGPFALTEQLRELPYAPDLLERAFDQFAPRGMCEARMRIWRKYESGQLRYFHDGDIYLTNANLTYHKFPYPLQDVTGHLHVNQEKVDIKSITGQGQSGTQVTITGTRMLPRSTGAIDVFITAGNGPIDDALMQAIPEHYRRGVQLFLDVPAHASLIDAGLIRSANTPGDQDVPGFDLGGRSKMNVRVTRPHGIGKRYTTAIDLFPEDVNLVFKYWPYPVKAVGGTIRVRLPHITLEDVQLQGPTGAIGWISGAVGPPPEGEQGIDVDLNVTAPILPLDNLLLAIIPKPRDQWPRQINLAGTASANAHVFRNDEGNVDFRITTLPVTASYAPFGGGYRIDIEDGQVRISPGRVEIDEVSGSYGPTTLIVAGQTSWVDGKQLLHIELAARDMRFEDPFLDLLPPQMTGGQRALDLYGKMQPRGAFDANVRINIGSDETVDFDVEIRPETIAFTHRGGEVMLNDVSGAVFLDPLQVQAESLAGSFSQAANGRIELSGFTMLEYPGHSQWSISAHSDQICPVTRLILPTNVLALLDRLRITTGYDLHDCTYVTRPDGQLHFTGNVRLENASADIGLNITELVGDLRINLEQSTGDTSPRMELHLNANRLRVQQRLISPLDVDIRSVNDEQTLVVSALSGVCYGGTFKGGATIQLGSPAQYDVQLTLDNAQFGSFVNPIPAGTNPDDPDNHDAAVNGQGFLTGAIRLSGIETVDGQPPQRKGAGAVIVREATLYQVPLVLSLLHLFNLTLPNTAAFDRIDTTFDVVNDRITFDQFQIEAPSLALVGNGAMQWSTREVDLLFYSKIPGALNLGPVTDIFNLLKDELLAVQVTGTIDDPRAALSIRTIARVADTWGFLFGPQDEKTLDELDAPAQQSDKRPHVVAQP